jgi:hypothetical protein
VYSATQIETGQEVVVKYIAKYQALEDGFTWEEEAKEISREVETLTRVKGCSNGVSEARAYVCSLS